MVGQRRCHPAACCLLPLWPAAVWCALLLGLLLISFPCPPQCTPSPFLIPAPRLFAAIDTFECAATFSRKGKKFSDPPELAIPEDLQDCLPAAADKGGYCALLTHAVLACCVGSWTPGHQG